MHFGTAQAHAWAIGMPYDMPWHAGACGMACQGICLGALSSYAMHSMGMFPDTSSQGMGIDDTFVWHVKACFHGASQDRKHRNQKPDNLKINFWVGSCYWIHTENSMSEYYPDPPMEAMNSSGVLLNSKDFLGLLNVKAPLAWIQNL